MRQLRIAIIAPVLAMLLANVGCGAGYSSHEPGPPPYAPAYGYRYRHPQDHVVLIYEPDLAMYRVSGYRDVYYRNGTYYRLRNNGWYDATRIKGHWTSVGYEGIPSGLQHRYASTEHTTTKYKAGKYGAAESKSEPPGMHAKKHYKRGKKTG